MSKSAKGSQPAAAVSDKMSAHASEILDEVDGLATSVGDTVHDLEAMLGEQADTRPYILLGAGAALGFVLGGGLTVRVGRLLLGLGGKAAARAVMRRLTHKI